MRGENWEDEPMTEDIATETCPDVRSIFANLWIYAQDHKFVGFVVNQCSILSLCLI